MMAKAVILSAGASGKFFKPLYDKPKGLFRFKGERLIERQIRQLLEAGITDIAVVLGYEKEQYFYLEEKFGVELFISEKHYGKGSLSSLMVLPKAWLQDTFVCCADHWYESNPFENFRSNRSVRCVTHEADATREFVVDMDDSGRLGNFVAGAERGLSLSGFAYFTAEFSAKLFGYLQSEQHWLGVESSHWEEFWGRHSDDLPLYGIPLPVGFREFDSLADLQCEDHGVLSNVSSLALDNICRILGCDLHEIAEIEPLNRGLTNVSFSFVVAGEKYVYRYPGYSSNNLVNRQAEITAQNTAMRLGIDSSVIAIGVEGWKLSKFVRSSKPFDYMDDALLSESIEQIKKFHRAGVKCDYEVDLLSEGDRLLRLAANKKGDLFGEYGKLREKLTKIWHYAELDCVQKVLCHNDIYAVNWLVGDDGLCLIDWEYAGVNDPLNDIATLVVRDELDDELTEKVLTMFYGHEPTMFERRHAYACFAMCAWYWYCWCLFKDTLGEDGFFMLPSWHGINKYLPLALDLYENH